MTGQGGSALAPGEPARASSAVTPARRNPPSRQSSESAPNAERFIQTALREWAYARAYQISKQRAQDLPLRTHRYNWHRPHSGIKAQTPVSQLKLNQDNLLRLHKGNALAGCQQPIAGHAAIFSE